MKHLSLVLLLSANATFAAEFSSDFSSPPLQLGWQVQGEANLFNWNSDLQILDVVWDSNQNNSYFYRSLPRYLTRKDDFAAELKLTLNDIQHGTTPGKPYTFQIAFGFINTTNAFAPAFYRGSGVDPLHGARNIIEFTYFPDSGFGATVGPVIATEKNEMFYAHSFPLELSLERQFLIKISFVSSEQILRTTITAGDSNFPVSSLDFPIRPSDFVVNAFSINSYSDVGQNPPQFSGSILAHAFIDDIKIVTPIDPQPVLTFATVNNSEMMFTAQPGWIYWLEATPDFTTWDQIENEVRVSTPQQITIPLPKDQSAHFYRIVSNRDIVR